MHGCRAGCLAPQRASTLLPHARCGVRTSRALRPPPLRAGQSPPPLPDAAQLLQMIQGLGDKLAQLTGEVALERQERKQEMAQVRLERKQEMARGVVPRVTLAAAQVVCLVFSGGSPLPPPTPSTAVSDSPQGEWLAKQVGIPVPRLDAICTAGDAAAHLETLEALDAEVAFLQPHLPVLAQMASRGGDAYLDRVPSLSTNCKVLMKYEVKAAFLGNFD